MKEKKINTNQNLFHIPDELPSILAPKPILLIVPLSPDALPRSSA